MGSCKEFVVRNFKSMIAHTSVGTRDTVGSNGNAGWWALPQLGCSSGTSAVAPLLLCEHSVVDVFENPKSQKQHTRGHPSVVPPMARSTALDLNGSR